MHSSNREKYSGKARCIRVMLCSVFFGSAFLPLPFVSHLPAASLAEAASSSPETDISTPDFSVFTPNPKARTTLDYSIWDGALSKVVLDFGPSTRLRARRPSAITGTRFVKGHKSAYRLEGSRFTFEFIPDDFRQGLTEYRQDLQNIATEYDITTFSKNEQLAFWLNLHNVGYIEQIAHNYPVERPHRIKIKIEGEKYRIDKAPFIEIMGQRISLEDIRTKIVFENWNNDNVIYGFFKGEIGSPSLPSYAYTGENVDILLNQNADDFVNSLRGFNLGGSKKYVSKIYEEAEPYYFKSWETDLQTHLVKYANETVRAELQKPYPFKFDQYDNMIADISGGQRLGSSGSSLSYTGVSYETARLLRELRQKRQYLRKRGIINDKKGYVIIEDLVPEEDLPAITGDKP